MGLHRTRPRLTQGVLQHVETGSDSEEPQEGGEWSNQGGRDLESARKAVSRREIVFSAAEVSREVRPENDLRSGTRGQCLGCQEQSQLEQT